MLWVSVKRVVLVLAVFGLVGACGSKGRVRIYESKSEAIPATAVAALDVTLAGSQSNPRNVEVASHIRTRLTRRLVTEGVFRSVKKAPSPADYRINVRIRRVNIVSSGRRVMSGSIGPRSRIDLTVKVLNVAAQKSIASFEASGFGSKSYLSSKGYGADDPVREAVDQIVKTLR